MTMPALLRVVSAGAAAVMEGSPGRTRAVFRSAFSSRVVDDGIRTVLHRLGLAVRRSDRERVEMIRDQ